MMSPLSSLQPRLLSTTPALPLSPRALLVENDPGLRRLLSQLLLQEGYHVVELCGGKQGLDQLLANAGAPFDLVVSDARVPEWSGVRLFGALRSAGIVAAVVLIADSRDRVTHQVAAQFRALVIHDPVDPQEFRAAVSGEPDDAA